MKPELEEYTSRLNQVPDAYATHTHSSLAATMSAHSHVSEWQHHVG